jgi:hypothetical protein
MEKSSSPDTGNDVSEPTETLEKTTEAPVEKEVTDIIPEGSGPEAVKPKSKKWLYIIIGGGAFFLLVVIGIVALLLIFNNRSGGGTAGPSVTPSLSVSPTGTVTPTITLTPTVTPTIVPGMASAVASVDMVSSTTCPATFLFSAQVTMTAAGSVKYQWVRSDGTSTTEQTLNFPGPGTQTVSNPWANTLSFNGWEKLKINSPNSLTSNQVDVSLSCNHSGFWYLNFGTMSITQTGTSAAMTYNNQLETLNGTLSGSFAGNIFTGTYGTGKTATLIFNDATNTFDGTWQTTVPSSGKWCGAKTGYNFPDGCSFAGKWDERMMGDFIGSDGCHPGNQTLVITRKNTSVSGQFCVGTFTGTISYSGGYNILSGTFLSQGGGGGDLTWYSSGYSATTFKGNYSSGWRGWCGWRSGVAEPATCKYP